LVDWVYALDDLQALEADLAALYGFDISFSQRFDNVGDAPIAEPRWQRLLDSFETDVARAKIQDFVELDLQLMNRLEW